MSDPCAAPLNKGETTDKGQSPGGAVPFESDAQPSAPLSNRSRLHEIVTIMRRHNLWREMSPRGLRLALADLGPTFIKFGQILSMRRDLLPAAYCAELAKLRTNAVPLPFSEILQVLHEELDSAAPESVRRESPQVSLAATPLARIFYSIDPSPLGSASIAQVHAALTLDGERVALKVRRPGIETTMARDIEILKLLARHARSLISRYNSVFDFEKTLNVVWQTARKEMDFRQEAANLREFARRQAAVRYVCCPEVLPDYSTERVLVMSDLRGIAIDDAAALRAAGYDLRDLGEKLVENYCKQILDDGFFQADPHPGNLRVRGGKIVWLDQGMMARLTSEEQELLNQAIVAVAEDDAGTLATLMLGFSEDRRVVNYAALYDDIDAMMHKHAHAAMKDIDLTVMLNDLMTIAPAHRLHFPESLTLLMRGGGTMQGTLVRIHPEVNFLQMMRNHLLTSRRSASLQQKMWPKYGRKGLRSFAKALDIPSELDVALKTFSRGQGALKITMEYTAVENQRRRAKTDAIMALAVAITLFLGGVLLALPALLRGSITVPDISWIFWGLATLSLVLGIASRLHSSGKIRVRLRKKLGAISRRRGPRGHDDTEGG